MERKRCTIALRPHSFGRFDLNFGDEVTAEIMAEGGPEKLGIMKRTRYWGSGWKYSDGTIEQDES